MFKNDNPFNKVEAWDLEEKEMKFYQGGGRATVVLGENQRIVKCYYHHAGVFTIRESDKRRAFAGTMSCYQFCPDQPILGGEYE